ncbi:MAG TPA: dockerin type I repeat-containing protein, partial [Terriglobales bacterium]|nr:dockerin type I repeat-containing protein [Terriglobales bacterium]
TPADSALIPYIVTFSWTNPNVWEQLRFDLHLSMSKVFNPDSTVIYENLSVLQFSDTLSTGKYYWKLRAHNNSEEKWSVQTRTLLVGIRGDANNDTQVSVSDVIFLVNYLFKGGSAPVLMDTGDANCDGKVTVSDVVYLINHLFKGGPKPC